MCVFDIYLKKGNCTSCESHIYCGTPRSRSVYYYIIILSYRIVGDFFAILDISGSYHTKNKYMNKNTKVLSVHYSLITLTHVTHLFLFTRPCLAKSQ